MPYSASSHGIVTKFWTYHDSSAVVACANFCSEHSITIRETTKKDSNRTWITSEKSFVKRALSAIYAPARPRCIFASACVYIEQIKGRRVITRRTLFCASTVDSTMPKCLTPSSGENLTRFRHIWFEYCHLRYFDIIWFDLADCQMNYKDISPRKRLTNEALVIPTLWTLTVLTADSAKHDDVIKWKHFPPYWPFSVRGIQRSTVDSPHRDQWREALMFSLICAWTNGWANIRDAGELRRHRDVNWTFYWNLNSYSHSVISIYCAICCHDLWECLDNVNGRHTYITDVMNSQLNVLTT